MNTRWKQIKAKITRTPAVDLAKTGVGLAAKIAEEQTGIPVGSLIDAGYDLQDILSNLNNAKDGILPNPVMLQNGLGDDGVPSPYTLKYLHKRKLKKYGSIAVTLAGKGFSIAQDAAGFGVGGIDIMGLVKHGTAEASTLAHLYRLRELGKRHRSSITISAYIDAVIKVKSAKAGVRGGHIAAAAIPNTIASSVVGAAASAAGAIAASSLDGLITKTACEIHWRAYRELKVGAIGGAGFGPASKIVQEIFNHIRNHGDSAYIPREKVRGLISEPGGWVAVKDKLSMM